MEHFPVDSSNVASISHRDPETGDFEVCFKGGSTYIHRAVPKEIYDGFVSDKSKGGYYHKHLKGRFEVSKVS